MNDKLEERMKRILFAILMVFITSCASIPVNDGICIPPFKQSFLPKILKNLNFYEEKIYKCNGSTDFFRIHFSSNGVFGYITIEKNRDIVVFSVKEAATFFFNEDKETHTIKDYKIQLDEIEWDKIVENYNKIKKTPEKKKNKDSFFLDSTPRIGFYLEVKNNNEYRYFGRSFVKDGSFGLYVPNYENKIKKGDEVAELIFYLIRIAEEKYRSDKKVEFFKPSWMEPQTNKTD
jgi:hypothetical protein